MQCTIGAFVGILAMCLPWIFAPDPHAWILTPGISNQRIHVAWDPYTNLLDMILSNGDYAFYSLLFFLGTVVALVTPLGGLAQGAGLLGFVLSYRALSMDSWMTLGHPNVHSYLSIGYGLAIISTILVVTSTSTAVRDSRGGKPVRALSRFAAMSPSSLR